METLRPLGVAHVYNVINWPPGGFISMWVWIVVDSNLKHHRTMLKWLIALFVAVFVIGLLQPRLARWLRFGRLPGDLRFRWREQEYVFPFATAVVLSLIVGVVGWLL